MKTEIIKTKGDWTDVVNDCRATVGKGALSKEPGKPFRRAILISEHSPIRNIIVKWRWDGIKSWIATHWSRHKWECYIKTQRSDRTGENRDKMPQDTPVTFVGEANAQNLIDTWRKRLCYQAAPETRKYAEDFKAALRAVDKEIADVLVPNCVYRCGCPEMYSCGWYSLVSAVHVDMKSTDIQTRYDEYNRVFSEKAL